MPGGYGGIMFLRKNSEIISKSSSHFPLGLVYISVNQLRRKEKMIIAGIIIGVADLAFLIGYGTCCEDDFWSF